MDGCCSRPQTPPTAKEPLAHARKGLHDSMRQRRQVSVACSSLQPPVHKMHSCLGRRGALWGWCNGAPSREAARSPATRTLAKNTAGQSCCHTLETVARGGSVRGGVRCDRRLQCAVTPLCKTVCQGNAAMQAGLQPLLLHVQKALLMHTTCLASRCCTRAATVQLIPQLPVDVACRAWHRFKHSG